MWLVLWALISATPSADDVSRAKVHFQAGKGFYELGNFSDAIREFAAGYALTPRPEFMINLGQAYRAAGDTAKALDMFEKYLEKAPSDAAPRRQVEALAAELRAQVAHDAPVLAADAPVAPPLTATELTQAAEPPPAHPEADLSAVHHPSPWVWAIPVGVVVVAGVVAGIAIAVARAPKCVDNMSLGCIDTR